MVGVRILAGVWGVERSARKDCVTRNVPWMLRVWQCASNHEGKAVEWRGLGTSSSHEAAWSMSLTGAMALNTPALLASTSA